MSGADRAELRAIAEGLRAQLEWSRELGATGLPSAPTAHPPRAEVSSSPAPAARVAQSALDSLAAAPTTNVVARAPSDDGGVVRSLAVLQQAVAECTRCALHQGRTHTVFARGDASSGLCFVGEGPGADEDLQGLPFVGAAGQLLDRMIVAMGLEPSQVYVCNIVKCRPPQNRKPEEAEMAECLPYLREQLASVAPRVIVALGATAVQGLLGTTVGITRLRGQWRLYGGKIPVMPTFHPAYLLRNPKAKREVWSDLQSVLQHLGRQPPARLG